VYNVVDPKDMKSLDLAKDAADIWKALTEDEARRNTTVICAVLKTLHGELKKFVFANFELTYVSTSTE
jgi:hypothetical protein